MCVPRAEKANSPRSHPLSFIPLLRYWGLHSCSGSIFPQSQQLPLALPCVQPDHPARGTAGPEQGANTLLSNLTVSFQQRQLHVTPPGPGRAKSLVSPCNRPISPRAQDSRKETLLVLLAVPWGSLPSVLISDAQRKVVWGLPPVKQGCFSRQWQSLGLSLLGYLQLCDPLSQVPLSRSLEPSPVTTIRGFLYVPNQTIFNILSLPFTSAALFSASNKISLAKHSGLFLLHLSTSSFATLGPFSSRATAPMEEQDPFTQTPTHGISTTAAAQPCGGRGSSCDGTIQQPPPESSWTQREAQAFSPLCGVLLPAPCGVPVRKAQLWLPHLGLV